MSSIRCVFAVVLAILALGASSPAQPPQPSQPPQPPQPPPQPGSLNPGAPRPIPPQFVKRPPPLDPAMDVRKAMESAQAQAAAESRRVLVIWVSQPLGEWSDKMALFMRSADMQQLLGMEFALLWVQTGECDRAEANRAIAKEHGVTLKGDEEHAVLTVIDGAGKALASKSGLDLVDKNRRGAYGSVLVPQFLNPLRQPIPTGEELLRDAQTKASSDKRCIFLCFGQWGDEWSAKFKAWLAQPEVAPILAKHSVVVHIDLLRHGDGLALMDRMGGKRVMTLPWWAIVGADGKPIATSESAQMPNIGFPTDDQEIAAFLDLLKRGSPGMTDADCKTIRDSLVEHRSRKG